MRFLIFILTIAFVLPIAAQKKEAYLVREVDQFSRKKTAYLTLSDGTEVEGRIKKLKRKRMFFEQVTLKDERDKETTYMADEIKSMYLPQSGWDKFDDDMSIMSDATRWGGETNLNQEYIKDGYAYFEKTEVYYKGRKKNKDSKVLLLQMLNPAFGGKVKVFQNPLAMESGVAIGGIKVSGNGAIAYFIKKGDEIAFNLKRKDYKKQAEELFGDCPEFFRKIQDDLKWKYLGYDIFDYTKSCEEE